MFEKSLKESMKGMEPTSAYNLSEKRIGGQNAVQVVLALRDSIDDEFWNEILKMEEGS